MANRIQKRFVASVLATVLCGVAASTDAAYVRGRFDPIEAVLETIFLVGAPGDTSCVVGSGAFTGYLLASAPGSTPDFGNQPDCAVSLYSAVATLTDTSPDPGEDAQAYVTFAFPADQIPIGLPALPTVAILGAYFSDGWLAGVDLLAGPALATATDSMDPPNNASLDGYWAMAMLTDQHLFSPPFPDPAAIFKQCTGPWYSLECTLLHADLQIGVYDGDRELGFGTLGDVAPMVGRNGIVQAAAVPEPGSLALLLGALGALFLGLRRATRI